MCVWVCVRVCVCMPQVESQRPLPALDALLQGRALAHLVRGYLGDNVRYESHLLKRCTEGNWSASTKANFAAGRWHHDRCGRRLKAFIYLSNVSAGSHPTQIAWPTHNTQYYTHHIKYFTLSRFADAHVRKNHRVASMAGPFGGGFLMDTNAIHKIELNGSDSRVVVTLEFHPHGKIGPLSVYDNPCPSRRRRVPDLKETWDKERWIHGEAGYDWYARE